MSSGRTGQWIGHIHPDPSPPAKGNLPRPGVNGGGLLWVEKNVSQLSSEQE